MRHPNCRDVRRLLNFTALCLLTCGCGAGSDLEKVIVRGRVTFDGQPIANGEVMFYPIEGTAGSVSGGPIKDGEYIAEGRGGVPTGKHRVEIRGFRAQQAAVTGDLAVEGGPAEQYLPPRYNTNSELTRSVDSENATHNFKLSSE